MVFDGEESQFKHEKGVEGSTDEPPPSRLSLLTGGKREGGEVGFWWRLTQGSPARDGELGKALG